ncbi:MAG: hypothetical protein KKH61_20930, partial [Gammaproteobacteria bacterium]|nr:hypothetical protein [Gammaproteobacteria bacterium]
STTAGHDHDGVSSEGDLAPTSLAVAGATTIAGNITPTTSHTRSLGSGTYEFSALYVDGVTVDTLRALNSYAPYEVFTTGDTLVATDSGKYLIAYNTSIASSGIVDFILPAVTAGLEYKIVSGGTFYIRVDTSSALEGIMYSTCVVGDRILSAGASADSVTLVSDGSRWYVAEMKGTWTDAS